MGVIHSGLWVAGMAGLMSLGSFPSLGVDVVPHVVALNFFATLVVYGLDRLLAPAQDALNVPARSRWVQAHGGLLKLQILLGVAGLVVALPQLSLPSLLVGVAGGVAALAYVLPGPGTFFKRLPLLKPLAVAVVWTLGCVLVPTLEAGVFAGHAGQLGAALLMLHHGLAVFVAALLFDLKDLAGDRDSGIRSAPVVWGSLRARALARAAAALAFGIGLLAWLGGSLSPLPMSLSLALLLLSLAPPHTDERAYYGLLVDGALGLPGLATLVQFLLKSGLLG